MITTVLTVMTATLVTSFVIAGMLQKVAENLIDYFFIKKEVELFIAKNETEEVKEVKEGEEL